MLAYLDPSLNLNFKVGRYEEKKLATHSNGPSSEIQILCATHTLLSGSWNNLDADFGSWKLDAGFCIIGLHRLDLISAAGDGLVAISLRALDKPFPVCGRQTS
jgi:hypothetical protein